MLKLRRSHNVFNTEDEYILTIEYMPKISGVFRRFFAHSMWALAAVDLNY